jgi:hypothetical protein
VCLHGGKGNEAGAPRLIDVKLSVARLVCLLEPDRNVRVLRSLEMSVYSTESVHRKNSACAWKVSHLVEMDCFPGTRCDGEAGFKLPVCRLLARNTDLSQPSFDAKLLAAIFF